MVGKVIRVTENDVTVESFEDLVSRKQVAGLFLWPDRMRVRPR